jgi:hypothetical protein
LISPEEDPGYASDLNHTNAKRNPHKTKITMHKATTETAAERFGSVMKPIRERTIDPAPQTSHETALILVISTKRRP